MDNGKNASNRGIYIRANIARGSWYYYKCNAKILNDATDGFDYTKMLLRLSFYLNSSVSFATPASTIRYTQNVGDLSNNKWNTYEFAIFVPDDIGSGTFADYTSDPNVVFESYLVYNNNSEITSTATFELSDVELFPATEGGENPPPPPPPAAPPPFEITSSMPLPGSVLLLDLAQTGELKSNGYIIAALYDSEGKLVGVAAQTVSTSETQKQMKVFYISDENSLTCKLFVWNGLSGAMSLETPYSKDITLSAT